MTTADIDASSGKHLAGKYSIVGVGETTYTRGGGRTTRAMATTAIANAMADAGLTADDVDGMLSYSGGDSTASTFVAGDLGIRLNFYMDVMGGGSSTEALIGIAMGVIEAGMCKTVAIFRSMNGFSQVRIGGTGARSAAPIKGDEIHNRAYGWQSAGQMFAPTFMRSCIPSMPRTIPRPTTRSASLWTRCSRAASSASRCICWTAASRPTTALASSSPRRSAPVISRSARR
jgi:hypothetical protein